MRVWLMESSSKENEHPPPGFPFLTGFPNDPRNG
jgi:hypothetical protein